MTDDVKPCTDKSQGRQFYVNTGHVRQRQALYFNENKQVDALYGINVAKIDQNNQKYAQPHDIHITVPALVCCGQGEGEGVPLCKPDCLPARPVSSPGSPLSDKYQTIKCRNSSPNATGANNNTIAYSSRPRSTNPTRHADLGASKHKRGQASSGRSRKTPRTPDKVASTSDLTPSDLITFDPSTRVTTTDPTTTFPTGGNYSSSELSSTLPSMGSGKTPGPYFQPLASDPDMAEEEDEPTDQEHSSNLGPIFTWPVIIFFYIAAWLLLIVYMCISCTAHFSIVIANVVLMVVFWCDSHCYHLCKGQ